jgi:hypothetical protein
MRACWVSFVIDTGRAGQFTGPAADRRPIV